MKDDKLNIAYISECIQKIQQYTQGGRDEFIQSSLLQDAVACNFMVIGEAVKNLSPELSKPIQIYLGEK